MYLLFYTMEGDWMINIAICDDNSDHLVMQTFLIEKILKENNQLIDIITFTDSKKLLRELENKGNAYDIIFLDIEMPFYNGLELGKEIRDINSFVIIIYITSHTKYVLSSFIARPFDYIMKPIDEDKLRHVLQAAIKYREEQLGINQKNDNVLLIKKNQTEIAISLEKIQYIEKQGNICIIQTELKQYEVYKTLKKLILELPDYFFLCHQSYIVNLTFVFTYVSEGYQLKNGQLIPVSRRKRDEAKLLFSKVLRGDFQ